MAPSRRILGGQAVQAERLIDSWQGDPDVEAWLVPIDPQPQRFAAHLGNVRYVRTAVSESLYLPRLRREVLHADVVHVFSRAYSSFLLAPLPAIIAARLCRRPVLLHYHHGEGPDHLRRSAISRAALARVDRNVVPSRYLRDVFAGFGLSADVVPNLIDVGRFTWRSRTPLRPRLLSTRNLFDLYNVECTLRAFAIVQRQRPDASLTVLGGGPCLDPLRALAQELRLSHVHFAGRIPPEEMPQVFDRHDIYIQSPNVDNVPNSVMEAFASGLPVVATAVGGVPSMTGDGRLALLAPRNDHEGLAHQVLRLLDEPTLAARLARDARRAAEAHVWPQVRGAWLRIYGDLLARRVHAGSADTARYARV